MSSQVTFMTTTKPLARTTDDATSHEAAERMVRTGELNEQCKEVLVALRKYPGLTSKELAAASGLDRHKVGRRMSDLVANDVARKGRPRMCSVGITRAQTWWPSEQNRQKGLFE